jgi:type IV pilus assembly protein PilY1
MARPTVWIFTLLNGLLTVLLVNFLVVSKGFAALTVAQTPLFLTPYALPVFMINMPKDHQLYVKAFDDYSDLDGDGVVDSTETTYKHSFNYYGYFDSYKCYGYAGGHFEPATISINKYCTGQWSGNFLNWVSMTRIDNTRKLLYGGLRATDTTETILERSYLPNDAHSFAKFYKGADVAQLTPFSEAEGITLCNTTVVSKAVFSQDVTDDPPLLRVARGNYSLWAANERWQCLWKEEGLKLGFELTGNGNDTSKSGMDAKPNNPSRGDDGLGIADYAVKVKVCVNDSLKGNDNCKSYKNAATGVVTLKPVGVLQTYGDEGKSLFGLITGSYGNNKSGGVLRKNVNPLTDEINVDSDGTFKPAPATGGIINTLNKLRIYGYRHNGGTLETNGTYRSDQCNWGLSIFNNGQCTNWGNPQSEMFLESLRYLAGKSASPTFVPAADDTGLTSDTATDPLNSDNYCASLNILQFNAGSGSYDDDELSGGADINITDLNGLTDEVGKGFSEESDITGKPYFVGEVIGGANNDQLCSAKTVSALSNVRGMCPEQPRLSGSYAISGLAAYAHVKGIRELITTQTVTTFGMAFSQSKASVVIDVPGGGNKKITLSPACQNISVGSCAIVDFKIISHNEPAIAGHETGKLYVNWEDSEQGGDFDQDMWGIINYDVSAAKLSISTNVIAQSSIYTMGFGYVIGGTNNDGFHAHSGINGYTDTIPSVLDVDGSTRVNYAVGNATASYLLQSPLFYASQWGGFYDGNADGKPDQASEWDELNNATGLPPGDGIPDQYLSLMHPKQVEAALAKVSTEITRTVGSSVPITTNATAISTSALLFQAKYDSNDWSGQLLAQTVNGNSTSPFWDAGDASTLQEAERHVFSYDPELVANKGIEFLYTNLSDAQQAVLTGDQLNFIRGNSTPGFIATTGFRARKRLLGDIVNSAPVYIGVSNNGYKLLPGAEGADYSNYLGSNAMLTRLPMLAVGANDGMLHVFDASSANKGKELFAYVPNTVMGNLAALTSPSYTLAGQHKYFVDGSPAVGDAYFDADNDNRKEWRTILVGTLGAGGKGIFALDVTFINPTDYNLAEPAFSAKRILWEINDQSAPASSDLDDVDGTPKQFGFRNNLGDTFAQAGVVRLANGQFAAIFGNGYNSASQNAVLYIVDIKDGSLIRSIGTGVSGDNGLSTPLAVDANKDGVVDAIYAGDLQGNMWKFDVSNTDPSRWGVAYTDSNTSSPAPLFTAKIAGQPGQPITVKPTFGTHPIRGVLLFFGTGSYFQSSDNVAGSSPHSQSFYGIWDECINYAGLAANCTKDPISGRSALVAQTIDREDIITTQSTVSTVRKTSLNDVNYTIKKGWYMDFVKPPLPGTVEGERVVSGAILRNRRIIFVTNTPSNIPCETEGESWLVELNPLTGGRLTQTPFDITGDGVIDSKDQISDGKEFIAASAFHFEGMVSKPAILKSEDPTLHTEIKYLSSAKNKGEIKTVTEMSVAQGHRQSWAQLH